ncbi:MAG: hypothetical protein ACYC2G_10780 [Gemmatimonadaceae bacterium]
MQPATPPQPPVPPAVPATPPPAAAVGANQVLMEGGRPVTAMDAATLRNRRSELSRQLNSADSRRQELASQLQSAAPGSQAGLVARIEVLDERIVQIEKDIAENGQRLAALPSSETSTSEGMMDGGALNNGQITGISIVFIIFVLMPLAIAIGRLIWKRGSTVRPQALPAGTDQRLERMEQGMDAIAIEVERISEGQRFVTRLLSERQELPALGGAAAAEPVPVRGDRA